MQSLNVFLHDVLVGHLTQDAQGYNAFGYEPGYLASSGARALSRSLPLRAEPYDHRACHPFFAGLLPDSEITRRALGEVLKVSKEDDFGLLSSLGRDCAGAVVISPGDGPATGRKEGWLEPLSDDQLATLISDLPHRPLFAEEGDVMLSLAGAHDKAAVFFDLSGVVSLPHRGHPSSHILKVDIKGLPNSIRTEFFCAKVAKDMKLRTPDVTMRRAGEHVFMLIARYDRSIRRDSDGKLLSIERLHQEDFCQARGLLPRLKYESKGGPTLADMVETIRGASTMPAIDIVRFVDFVAYNFLIGNPDSHAKNYSILYKPTAVELAPLYDMNNAVAFARHYKEQRPRFAHAIGGEFIPEAVTAQHWTRQAEAMGVGPRQFLARVLAMAEKLPAATAARRERCRGELADCPELDDIVVDVRNRCAAVAADLQGVARPQPEPLPSRLQGTSKERDVAIGLR